MWGVDSVKNRLFKSMVVYLIWLMKLYCNTLQANEHPPNGGAVLSTGIHPTVGTLELWGLVI